ncbi:DUF397 domain-containing protein [Kitasatospora aureofaciens]|uniref:DUF397 domain-containing protein n=1 Tax=Kitasatospora aureofaciens TaxID=1894 RepID=A0A1E7MZY5_KITAU|nr:DUF397 domain-containing protein [Kitasatospora aureofaciens]QEU99052.1 DUF397 domain-containing protein [Streptomyces viridifaciens]ARF77864.1 DUF397 domain-containing protein [Kitasatospora aureofaciens]OEV34007.1 DUF397 domain-containing protein [Kitasatospora aureofaciens]UKZ05084.1 DUF397 domain-containing protein [Streptomyces viridifaciens]GGU73290.1 DUF397 domain-containing protein [Kitasatospora aureofaciens]
MNSELAWFKSSHSGTEGGACVEIALAPDTVHVRDSKDKTGPQLCFTPEAWTDFVQFAREVSPLDR